MYRIDRRPFGVQFAFEGTVNPDEMKHWSNEARQILHGQPKGFGVLVDNRNLRPGGIGPEAQAILEQVQNLYKSNGMERSCVVLSSAAVTMQLERAARASGIRTTERFINASAHPNWEQMAVAWIEKGEEPN
jgi:hypothetical protein